MNSRLFKGIALLTPGGDLVYSLDSNKQENWHIHLCTSLQRLLGLEEPPHFLIPNYTATVDRWFDPYLSVIQTTAELYPPLLRYQPLLNVIFGLEEETWQVAPWREETCNPLILETYRSQFPQLWQSHDLVARINKPNIGAVDYSLKVEESKEAPISPDTPQGYVLRLFVSDNHSLTKGIFKALHEFLEQEFRQPYTLKIIDISKHPDQAEIHQISATPTLVRVFPRPIKRIVGTLDNLPRVLQLIAK